MHLDKYYTRQDIAEKCCRLFQKIARVHYDKDIVIEPSAGDGSFIKPIKLLCKKSIFIDIAPEHKYVKKADYLSFKVPYGKDGKDGKIWVLGNPPFGFRSSGAIKFIRKSCEFCDGFGFILPKSFIKQSMQKSVPLDFHLAASIMLPVDSFKDISVPCVFQVWMRKNYLRKKPVTMKPDGYEFVGPNDNPDFAIRRVGSKAGYIFQTTDKNPNDHYFVRLLRSAKIPERLRSKLMYYVTGPLSISKQDIIRMLNKRLKK